jgi:hypothetical protein
MDMATTGNKMAIARLALLFLLLVFHCQSAMTEEMQIFELKGTTPQEMIPLIKPFVGPDGTVTGMHNQLIVRTSAERMTEVRKILQELDRAPCRLLIHVRDSMPSETEGSRAEFSVRNPHLQIGEGEKNRLRLKRYSTESREANQRTLQTLEGQPTLISSGISRPEVTRNGYIIGPRGGYMTGYDYKEISSGFYATVQLLGDRVRIEITTQKQAPIRGSRAISQQTTDNVVSGHIGEWLPLAATHTQQERKHSGIGSRASSESSAESEVWVKVELLPD